MTVPVLTRDPIQGKTLCSVHQLEPIFGCVICVQAISVSVRGPPVATIPPPEEESFISRFLSNTDPTKPSVKKLGEAGLSIAWNVFGGAPLRASVYAELVSKHLRLPREQEESLIADLRREDFFAHSEFEKRFEVQIKLQDLFLWWTKQQRAALRSFLFIVDWLCDFEANIRTLGENHGIIFPGPEDIVLKAGMGPTPRQDHLDGSFARTHTYE